MVRLWKLKLNYQVMSRCVKSPASNRQLFCDNSFMVAVTKHVTYVSNNVCVCASVYESHVFATYQLISLVHCIMLFIKLSGHFLFCCSLYDGMSRLVNMKLSPVAFMPKRCLHQVTVTASTSSTTIVQANHTAASPGMFPSSRKHPDDRSVPASEEDLFEHLNSFCYSSHPEWSKIIEPQSSAVGGQTPSVSGDTDCSALPEVTHSSLCPQESFSSSRCSLSGGNR